MSVSRGNSAWPATNWAGQRGVEAGLSLPTEDRLSTSKYWQTRVSRRGVLRGAGVAGAGLAGAALIGCGDDDDDDDDDDTPDPTATATTDPGAAATTEAPRPIRSPASHEAGRLSSRARVTRRPSTRMPTSRSRRSGRRSTRTAVCTRSAHARTPTRTRLCLSRTRRKTSRRLTVSHRLPRILKPSAACGAGTLGADHDRCVGPWTSRSEVTEPTARGRCQR